MSATVDAGRFIDYFAGESGEPTPRSTHIPGRAFPVDEVFVEEYLPSRRLGAGIGAAAKRTEGTEGTATGTRLTTTSSEPRWTRRLATSERRPKALGAVLVFLPGVPEISRAEQAVSDVRDVRVFPLHGQLAPEDQRAAFAPSAAKQSQSRPRHKRRGDVGDHPGRHRRHRHRPREADDV